MSTFRGIIYDLSGSFGIAGQTEHKKVLDAKRRVVEACKHHGKAAGIHLVIPGEDSIRDALSQGFTFIALGMDTVFLRSSGKTSVEMYSRLSK